MKSNSLFDLVNAFSVYFYVSVIVFGVGEICGFYKILSPISETLAGGWIILLFLYLSILALLMGLFWEKVAGSKYLGGMCMTSEGHATEILVAGTPILSVALTILIILRDYDISLTRFL